MSQRLRWAGFLGALVLVLGLAGCVGSDDGEGSSAGGEGDTAAGTPDPDRVVTVTLGQPHELGIELSRSSMSAGEVTFDVTNAGALPHQFVIVPHEGDPADLPVTGPNADVAQVQVLGDSGSLDPSATASITATLEPGSYVIFSNIAGHYPAGMFAAFTVE